MSESTAVELTAERALIFRICHIDNFEWHVRNGLVCPNSNHLNPNHVAIGNPDLIAHRAYRAVLIPPFGTLSDYVPFYFTPHSPMLLNIKTGYNGVLRRSNSEIIILVSALDRLKELNVPFMFTDRHAYLATASFYLDTADLDKIDWEILRRRDFRRDNEDPGKGERYQAEVLVHKLVPWEAIIGVACYDSESESKLSEVTNRLKKNLTIVPRSNWYF